MRVTKMTKKKNVIKERGIREKEESVLKETRKKETEKFDRVRHRERKRE